MITEVVTELGSEVKLTPPDEVQSFHVQHLPHPHSVTRNHGAVREAAVGMGYVTVSDVVCCYVT